MHAYVTQLRTNSWMWLLDTGAATEYYNTLCAYVSVVCRGF